MTVLKPGCFLLKGRAILNFIVKLNRLKVAILEGVAFSVDPFTHSS